jgi:hypothetical protein
VFKKFPQKKSTAVKKAFQKTARNGRTNKNIQFDARDIEISNENASCIATVKQ